MHAQSITPAFAVGAAVYSRDRIGYVARVNVPEFQGFTLGTGRMERVTADVEIAFDGHLSSVPDTIAAPWLLAAQRMDLPGIEPEEAEERRAALIRARQCAAETARLEREAHDMRAAAFRVEAAAKMPTNAKAVIVAELHEDASDSMSDYHNHRTVKTVILAWSTHTRDLFPELRKAALNFAEAQHLATAEDKAEHREKYSMGAGFYLKNGWRDSSGWCVKKVRLYDAGAAGVPMGEWSLPDAQTRTAATPAVPASSGVRIEQHTHTKGGFAMWVVVLADRVERAEYERLLSEAKALGGWYSKKWGASPAGFAFKSAEAAQQFAGEGKSAPSEDATAPTPAPSKVPTTDTAEKLRGAADKLQGEIDGRFADRLTNTPKRQREAQSARLEGYRLQRVQQAMRALADHYEAGTVPADLHGVTTKAALYALAAGEIERSGYYDGGRETGKPAQDTPQTRALWALISGRSDADKAADALRQQIDGLQFAKIPGYFPTPADVVAQMIEAADIPDGCRVLEPSAGSGAILDAVKAAAPACELRAFEHHHSLRRILAAKGYALTGDDFTESDPAMKVERVLMNPPFENGQDAAHVRRAFDHLAPGGRLVAIMSPGPFFRQDSKASAFRAWFEHHGGEKTDLPAGSFKESGTMVATVLVVLDA